MEDKEEQLLIAKIKDRIRQAEFKNRIEVTDFLNLAEKEKVEIFLKTLSFHNFLFWGGFEEAERVVAIFYPEKLAILVEEKKIDLAQYLAVIRIQVPKEKQGEYNHKNYLGAMMKLGMKREKIGDISVYPEGADIIIKPDIQEYVLQSLPELTRFQKANIELISTEEMRIPQIELKRKRIIIPSFRLDAIISEIIGSSRTKAVEIINQERVFLNFKVETKVSKEVKIGDKITVRGKGKFEIGEEIGNSKKNKKIVEIIQWQS